MIIGSEDDKFRRPGYDRRHRESVSGSVRNELSNIRMFPATGVKNRDSSDRDPGNSRTAH